ncbi:MAG: hypothetical protein U9Q30_08230, partial [Campylobacterota bacterium]|nr:hypothetical protein [Campylobacterota bacterium]
TEEVAEEPTEEVAEEPTEEVAEEPTEEVAEEPTEEVAEEPTEEVAEETNGNDKSEKGVGNEVAAAASGKDIKDKFTDEDGESTKNVDNKDVEVNSYEIGFSIENADEDTEVLLDNIPKDVVVKDVNVEIIEPNEDEQYLVSPDTNGDIFVTIDSEVELSDEQLDVIDAEVIIPESSTLANDTEDSISTDDDNDLSMTTDSDFTIDTDTEFELNYDNVDLDSQSVINPPIENVNISADEVMAVDEESAIELPGSEDTTDSLDTDTWSSDDSASSSDEGSLDLDTAHSSMGHDDIQVMMDTMPTDHNI